MLKEETLAEKFIKKGFWLYLFTFLIAPAGYFIRVIISNDLEVSDVGILYSIISLITIISTYNDLGFTGALNYFLPKYWINEKYNSFKTAIFLSLSIQLITGVLISLLLYFGADFLAANYFHSPESTEILKIFCFYFLGINLFQIVSTIFNSFQDTFNLKFIEFIRMWSIFGFIILFYFQGGSIFNYALSWLIGILFGVFIGVFIFFKKYNSILKKGNLDFDRQMISEYKSYAIWSFLGMNAGVILGQIDQQMVIYFLGPESAGYYSNYLSLMIIFSIIITPILGFLFPVINEIYNKKQFNKLQHIQDFFYKYIGIFALSFGAFLFVFGPVLSLIFFGEKFILSGELLVFSSLFLFIQTLFTINFSFLAAFGLVRSNVKIVGFAALVNLILNFIFIQIFGIVGPILSTVIGWILMFTLSLKLFKKNQKIIFDWLFFLRNLFYIFVILLSFYFIKDSFFIFENIYRYQNLAYLVLFGISYYLILSIVNYKDISILKREIFKIIKLKK